MILVSVLIPVYNASGFLEEALSSILYQSHRHLEIILVDDCSSDNSVELIKRFQDDRIRLVELKKNGGIGGALNAGLAIATGKYILRMDADDIALADRIEKQVDFMENHPEIGVSGALAKHFNGTPFNTIVSQEQLKPNLLLDSVFAHPTVIIRKALLDANRIKFNGYLEDYELWVALSSLTEFGLLPQVVLQYRRSDQQFTASNHRRRTNETNLIRVKFAEKWLRRSLSSKEILIISSEVSKDNQPEISLVIALCEELIETNPWTSKIAAILTIKKLFLKNFYRSNLPLRDSLQILTCSFLGVRVKIDLLIKLVKKFFLNESSSINSNTLF